MIRATAEPAVPRRLRAGDVVEVRPRRRSWPPWTATAAIDGLPFMPEMLAVQRATVHRREPRGHDLLLGWTAPAWTRQRAPRRGPVRRLRPRRLPGRLPALLEGGVAPARRTAQRRPSIETTAPRRRTGAAEDDLDCGRPAADRPRSGGERWSCQATELPAATAKIHHWDLRHFARRRRATATSAGGPCCATCCPTCSTPTRGTAVACLDGSRSTAEPPSRGSTASSTRTPGRRSTSGPASRSGSAPARRSGPTLDRARLQPRPLVRPRDDLLLRNAPGGSIDGWSSSSTSYRADAGPPGRLHRARGRGVQRAVPRPVHPPHGHVLARGLAGPRDADASEAAGRMTTTTEDLPVVVLGSGMAAMGAAHASAPPAHAAVCLEAQDHAGGHTTTFDAGDGFLFDDGPHVSFTSDERIAALMAEAVDGRYRTVEAVIDNVWRGHRMRHPVQLNLHGLPADLCVDILTDFVTESCGTSAGRRATTPTGWWRPTAGPSPRRSRWSTGASTTRRMPQNLTTEWLGPRMYRPDLEEMLRGALDATARAQALRDRVPLPRARGLRRLPGRPPARPRRPARPPGRRPRPGSSAGAPARTGGRSAPMQSSPRSRCRTSSR